MIGKTISHYRITEKLGEGGMGVVYKAEDTKLQRQVALKFLSERAIGTKEDRIRFLNEARAAAALNHPNICTIHEIDEMDDKPFIVMEYLEGESLDKIIETGEMPVSDTLRIARQIAEGLSEAHRLGIVHRDIKPANIMITGGGRVKIMDFGLARAPGGSRLTTEATTLGTIAYMSPEQTHGEGVDHRSDIWAFGVILYQMLSGQLPFRGDYDQAIIYSILNEDPPPIPEVDSDVAGGLENVTRKALSKDPGERYQGMIELISDIDVPEGLDEKSMTGERPAGRGFSRKSIFGLVASAVLVICVAFAVRYMPGCSSGRIESIAVLPLENMSGDPEQEYISDGMTESLITELSHIRSLRIISRTSVMRYKDTDKSLPEIARELGVDAIVEGSAILAGDQIRVTTQLIEARTDRHLWAQDYVREFKDVLSLQKEVAREVTSQVRAVLTPDEEAGLSETLSVDPEVQKLYLRGRYHVGRLTARDQNLAIGFLESVIEKSPDHALACVALSEAYNNLVALDGIHSAEGSILSKQWAQRALEIDDSLGEAYIMIADIIALFEWKWDEAEAAYKKGLELSPGYMTGHLWYGTYLIFLGRYEEAKVAIEEAYRLDPINPGVLINMAGVSYRLGDAQRAMQICLDAIDVFPEFVHPYYVLARIYFDESRFEEGLETMRRGISFSASEQDSFRLASFYAWMGREEEARSLLDEMLALPGNEILYEFIIKTYVQLGEMDSAFEYLEKAYSERAYFLVGVYRGNQFRQLRDDPRFEEFCRRLGFSDCGQ